MFKRAKQREPYQTLQTTYAPILRKSRLEMHVRLPLSKYKMRHVQKLWAIWKTLTCWGSQSRMQLLQEVLFPSSHNSTKGVQWSPWIRRSKPYAFSAYGEREEFIPPPPLRIPCRGTYFHFILLIISHIIYIYFVVSHPKSTKLSIKHSLL